ncbi:MAG: plasmid mobilization protein [archaeon]
MPYSDRKGKIRTSLYYDEKDWEKIERNTKKAKCKNTTDYIRKISLEGQINVYDFKDAHNLIYEMNKIGINVNQLAKKANEINNIYEYDIVKLKKEYDDLCHMLSQFLLELQSGNV